MWWWRLSRSEDDKSVWDLILELCCRDLLPDSIIDALFHFWMSCKRYKLNIQLQNLDKLVDSINNWNLIWEKNYKRNDRKSLQISLMYITSQESKFEIAD